jgi:hypothetical protein
MQQELAEVYQRLQDEEDKAAGLAGELDDLKTRMATMTPPGVSIKAAVSCATCTAACWPACACCCLCYRLCSCVAGTGHMRIKWIQMRHMHVGVQNQACACSPLYREALRMLPHATIPSASLQPLLQCMLFSAQPPMHALLVHAGDCCARGAGKGAGAGHAGGGHG